MIRTTALLAAALLTFLLAPAARADFIYTFTTTGPAVNAGSLNGSFDVADSVVAGGSIDIKTQAKSAMFTLSGAKSPFENKTYTLSDFSGSIGTQPIPVKSDGSFNYMSGQMTTLRFVQPSQSVSLGITQTPPSPFEIDHGNVGDFGLGQWTVTHTSVTTPEPSSFALVIMAGAFVVVGGVCHRMRAQRSNQPLRPQF